VAGALAKMANVADSEVTINDVGPSWGANITDKAIKAVIVFLVLCSLYIWLRFEGKMAVGALTALVHDIVVTAGIYSLSGFQVSPDTVIAFLTILGYSLYDTIVVFDKVQENTKGLASTGRLTYTETVNLSMNQVLARSLNTSFVAILPILSILLIGSVLLHATALNDFGLALLVGLTTGAYSSIFIASPIVALLKEREPRYAQIRERLASRSLSGRHFTPLAAAGGNLAPRAEDTPPPFPALGRRPGVPRRRNPQNGATPEVADGASNQPDGNGTPVDESVSPAPAASASDAPSSPGGAGGATTTRPTATGARPGVPPRPRKKRRR
jgi:preprotein translocase subunit SecF